jgi:ureidoglycolate lyase
MIITPRPLTAEAFSTFGEVIDTDSKSPLEINQGYARRFDDLASLVATSGNVKVSLFTADPRTTPIEIKVMERHPLGSQLFYPLQDRPWLVLVCINPYDAGTYKAFLASGRQGVNYAPNTWHHPLLVHDADSRFIIVDRKGSGNNLEEVWLENPLFLQGDP